MQTDATARIDAHLRYLAETLGPRPAGSEACRQASAYVRDRFAALGLTLEEISFPVVNWQPGETVLELGGQRLPAAANPYSPGVDVTAGLLPLATPAELEAAEITGKVLLFYGNLSAAPLIPLHCQVYNAERDQRINRLLAERRPAAIITVNNNPPAIDALTEDADLPIPALTVAAPVGRTLLAAAGQPVHVRIQAESTPAQAVTWVARTSGPAAPKLVLMAHYDTKHATPGALDNAGGIAVLLELAERLPAAGLPYGLELIAFGDEEYYAYSDGMYVERHGAQFGDILAAINFDGAGQRLGVNTICIMAHSPAFQAAVEEQARAFPAVTWVDPWPESNHSTFAFRGVPAIAFGSQGVNRLHHQPDDSVEWASPERLAEVAELTAQIAGALAGQSPAWTRPLE